MNFHQVLLCKGWRTPHHNDNTEEKAKPNSFQMNVLIPLVYLTYPTGKKNNQLWELLKN